MTTKTTGIEFKKFWHDKSVWPDGICVEDETIIVNKLTLDETEWDEIQDDANVSISGGCVYDENDPEKDSFSFEGYFKKWRKAQSVEYLIVEVKKDRKLYIMDEIVRAGGTIK